MDKDIFIWCAIEYFECGLFSLFQKYSKIFWVCERSPVVSTWKHRTYVKKKNYSRSVQSMWSAFMCVWDQCAKWCVYVFSVITKSVCVCSLSSLTTFWCNNRTSPFFDGQNVRSLRIKCFVRAINLYHFWKSLPFIIRLWYFLPFGWKL